MNWTEWKPTNYLRWTVGMVLEQQFMRYSRDEKGCYNEDDNGYIITERRWQPVERMTS